MGPTQSLVAAALGVCAAQAMIAGTPDSTGWRQGEGKSGVPTHLVLLYDNSNSQRGIFFAPAGPETVVFGRTTTVTRDKVVAAIARALPTGARMRVASFGHRILISETWVRTASEIERAFGAVEQPPGAPSPIWDGVWHAADALQSVSGRRILVVITDGLASANVRGFSETSERVAGLEIVVHGIQTVSPKLLARIDADADSSASIRELAHRTGGTLVYRDQADLPEHIGRLAKELGR